MEEGQMGLTRPTNRGGDLRLHHRDSPLPFIHPPEEEEEGARAVYKGAWIVLVCQ